MQMLWALVTLAYGETRLTLFRFYVFRRDYSKQIFDYRRMDINPSNRPSLFARRLREARLRVGIPQDKLGVMIGIDEGVSSARMSRYETGVHEPPFQLVVKIADILGVPAPYFYCDDDTLAELLLIYRSLAADKRAELVQMAKNL